MVSADFSSTEADAFNPLITATADRLRSLSQRSLQGAWHYTLDPRPASTMLTGTAWQQWPLAVPNGKDHIAWPRGQQALWLCQQLTVPPTLNGFPLAGLSLRLRLTWWAEAVTVYVQGQAVQQGDLFDCLVRLPLSDRVTPGDTFTIALHLVSPGHDDGALVQSVALYESPSAAFPEPGFVADELTVLQTYATQLAPEKLPTIAAAIAPLDWSQVPLPEAFPWELARLRERLLPLSTWIKQRRLTCVGHAHLDLAWLWPVEDTWRAAERTFRSVLALQAEFPELTYTHSSPALFAWLETHQPELFQQVVAAVQAGTWAIDAGLWVEPELNTLGGESLARQILYGQRYTQSRFGQRSAIAWLPDSFGFSAQLPQLLHLGGIHCFATQKLRWNEATTFPHQLFWWQGLDGTQILSLTLPPIGTAVDPVPMATHGAAWEAHTQRPEALWLPGLGDHGGGPTRDMLTQARRWQVSPFFPQLGFSTVADHLHRLTGRPIDSPALTPAQVPLPIWQDELYLELHRGCYTVHADQKWFNRRCEDALREAELFAAIAHHRGALPYPQAALTTAWQQVLFNQFHDILPGTAIPEVFVTANQSWAAAAATAQGIRAEALAAIAPTLPCPAPPQANAVPLLLFNSLNWAHTDLVEVPLSALPTQTARWRVFDPDTGAWTPTQRSDYTDQTTTAPGQATPPPPPAPRLLLQATVPALGYRWVWLVPDADPAPVPPAAPAAWTLSNDFLQAVIDPATGEVVTLTAHATGQTVVRSPANQLQAFQDAGQYWDAWDIAPNYESHPLPAATVQALTWLETGPLRQRLRVVRQIADSTLQQDYVLDSPLPYLKVATVAHWRATQVVLKTAFPLSFSAPQATYEIPFGAIARPTASEDPHAQAKWEVPAYRWADMGNGDRGLSVLTDYKHGFDAKPDQLRLTLLKAPLWPDPQADRGYHGFTYGLYPHGGDWRAAQTPAWAIAFNTPLQWLLPTPIAPAATAPSSGQWWPTQTTGTHLAALKLAEDDPDQYILRLWELYGTEVTVDLGTATVERTDLLEAAIAVDAPHRLTPWQIATFKVALPPPHSGGTQTNPTPPH